MKGQGQSAESEETGAKKKQHNVLPGWAIVPWGFGEGLSVVNVAASSAGWHAVESLKSMAFAVSPRPMPKNPTAAPATPLPTTYESALQELEQLVGRLESGQMPLDELLAGYQRGAALLAFCKDKLQAVEDQIRVLDGGQAKTRDMA